MKRKALISGIVGYLLLFISLPVVSNAQIASEQAFENLSWEIILEDELEGPVGVVQAVCDTEDYIICIENYQDGNDTPDIIKAYYKNDTDADGNKVEQYSLAKRVARTNYEHANGMAYNPNTNEIAVSLYTDYDPENEGSLFIMDADTLEYKRKVKVAEGYNILGIDYDEENDRYIIQTNAEGGYRFQILDSNFSIIDDMGDLNGYEGDGNYQDLCVTGDYILNFPLTLVSGGDYLNVYSISQRKILSTEKLDFQFQNVANDEPESICEVEPGVFVAVVNVKMNDGSRKMRLYKTTVPYNFQITVSKIMGDAEPVTSEQTILRGESFRAWYKEVDGYKLAGVTVDKEDVNLEKHKESYTLENIQADHKIQIIYKEKSGMWKIVLISFLALLLAASFGFYLKVLQIRRIRRAKLEAERRRRARIRWQNDEWDID